ncbi:MAG: hypothetical protein GEU80_02630 [Dehalococcoidia bacterium]|nr:hypothetical protein [Dehalococcoidia bacterium]
MTARDELEALLRRRGNVTTRELRRAVERQGYSHLRTTGGHHIYGKAGFRSLAVPQSVTSGTAAAILRRLAAELGEEE